MVFISTVGEQATYLMLHDSAHGTHIITNLPEVNTLFSVFLEKDTQQKIVHIHLKAILVQYNI